MIVAVHTWRDHYLMWSDKKCTNDKQHIDGKQQQPSKLTTSKTISAYTQLGLIDAVLLVRRTQHHFEYICLGWMERPRSVCGVLHTSTHCDGCVTNGLACNNAGIACTQCKWKWARKRNKNSKNRAEKIERERFIILEVLLCVFSPSYTQKCLPSDSA